MRFLDDPVDMTPEQRFGEIAAILAEGCRRLSTIPSIENKGLDVSRDPIPPCESGLTDRDPAEVER